MVWRYLEVTRSISFTIYCETKTCHPVGGQQFANQMRADNIPMEWVGNVTRRPYIQQKHSKRTPQKRTATVNDGVGAGVFITEARANSLFKCDR